jgi:endonuclease III
MSSTVLAPRRRHAGRGLRSPDRSDARFRQAPRELLAWLQERFESERLGNKRNPLDEALFIILSKQTQDPVYRRVFRNFKRAFPQWEAVADAPVTQVAAVIEEAGFATQRAEHIRALARTLRVRFGRVTLAPLRSMSADEAEEILRQLPGLGRKSAKCVLLYSLGIAALPIDVHTLRVSKRLGLLDEQAEARSLSTQVALEAAVPRAAWYGFHVGAVEIGRSHCLTNAPRCGTCPISKWCHFVSPLGSEASQDV